MSEETPKSGSNIPKSGGAPGKGSGADKADKGKKGAAPAKPKRGLFRRLVLWVFLLAVITGAGAAATFDVWRPYAEPHIAALLSKMNLQTAAPAQNEQLMALAARVAALEQSQSSQMHENSGAAGADTAETAALQSRLEVLEKSLEDVRAMASAAAVTGGGDSGETPAAVTETFTRINDRIAELERAASEAAGPGEITALASRLGALETQAAESDSGAEGRGALMVVLGDLRAAMAVGAPYKATLAAAAAMPDAAPQGALAALETCAATGAPTAARLREDFRAAAREAARARVSAEGGGWMDTVAAKAASLVSVRRIGASASGALDGGLASAERALADGDTAAAVKALEGLEGAPAAAVQPWIQTARMRLGCEQGLASLSAAAAAWLSGG
ncbi:MAG: COG4223 family protein [Rhodospirillales bacterium]